MSKKRASKIEIETMSNEIDKEKVKRTRNFLFHDFSIPGRSDLVINRKAYPKEVSNQTYTYEDMVRRGKELVREYGWDTIDVPGGGNESLYRAVCHGLFVEHKEDDYLELYDQGITLMGKNPNNEGIGFTENPRDVLAAVAEFHMVRIIVFNAIGKKREVVMQFSPRSKTKLTQPPTEPKTVIETTAYVLCVPSIDAVTQAYALKKLPPVLIDEKAGPSSKEHRIFRQNTRPMPFEPTDDQAAAIERLKKIPWFSGMRCLYAEKEPPPK